MDEQAEAWWVSQFCRSEARRQGSDGAAADAERLTPAVRELLEGPTVDGAGIRGTALGLAAAGGERLDHYRPAPDWERRVAETMIEPQPEKLGVEELALEAAGVARDELERRYQARLEAARLSGQGPTPSRSRMPPKANTAG